MGLLDFIKAGYHQVNPFDEGRTFKTYFEDKAEREAYKQAGLAPPEQLSPDARRQKYGSATQRGTHAARSRQQPLPEIDPFRSSYGFDSAEYVDAYTKERRLDPKQAYSFLFPYKEDAGKLGKAPSGQFNLNKFIANAQSLKKVENLGYKRVYIGSLRKAANEGNKDAADTLAALKTAGVLDEQDSASSVYQFTTAVQGGPARITGKAIRRVGLEGAYNRLTGDNLSQFLEDTGDAEAGVHPALQPQTTASRLSLIHI